MAYIDYTRKDSQSALQETVCLTGGECIVLQPVVKKEIKRASEKVAHYEDKISDGYGTTLQATKLEQWQNILETLESIERSIDIILKRR